MQTQVEIITVGNELLIGKILNTNARWLCRRITSLGGKVTRVTTVPDDVNTIASSIEDALRRRKPGFIITVGGLGPTHDDKTLQGVARAMSQPLQLNREALRMVDEKYRELASKGFIKKSELTSERVKMAKLPKGAKPIFNPVGTAPATLARKGKTHVISLPGVPGEMQAIFNDTVVRMIAGKCCGFHFEERSLMVTGVPESELSPIIDRVMEAYPSVYVKSHPKGEEKRSLIELHFSTTARNRDEAKVEVNKSVDMITSLIRKVGGKAG